MERTIFEDDHDAFRQSVRSFIRDQIAPNHDKWSRDGIVDREMFRSAGRYGFLGMGAPEALGGGGIRDFRYNVVINEEIQRAGVIGSGAGWILHNDVYLPYFLAFASDDQQARWLPGICSGERITAIAMTEPAAGSDLSAVSTTAHRDGDHYVVNGAKTFITNGLNADLIITAVKTDPTQRHRGMSLLVIEGDAEGLERGRNLDKLGLHAQDTAELFFNELRVPVENLLGDVGAGFTHLVRNLAQERLSIAITAVAGARAALLATRSYVNDRHAFGKPLSAMQNTRFRIAEMVTEVEIAQSYVDRCTQGLNEGTLAPEEAAMAKWWCTELQKRVVDGCLQLHGGYGYMTEYPIARAYADARITRIYGGTTEICLLYTSDAADE